MNKNNTYLRLMGDYLVINGVGNPIFGFENGKAGIALVLFELATELNNERFEDYAFLLIQEALLSQTEIINFSNGLTGIGYVLLYLINNGFIKSDFNDVFADKHKLILKEIADNSSTFSNLESFYFVEYFRMTNIIPKEFELIVNKKNNAESDLLFQYSLNQMNINTTKTDTNNSFPSTFSTLFLNEYYKNLSKEKSIEHSVIISMKNKILMSNIRRVKIVLLDLLSQNNKSNSRLNELLMIV